MSSAYSSVPRGLAAWLVISLAVGACSVYDSQLLTVRSKSGGVTSPTAGNASLIDASTPFGDGGSTLGPDQEPGDNTRCGDGRVSGVEKCDIAIEAGKPGACPTACPDLAACVPRVLNPSGCQTECLMRPLVCMSGDSCCPGNCNTSNDSDCTGKCGDGIMQSGETCGEKNAAPCKKSDAECDDKNACTTDKLTGSAANCSSACSNTPVTAVKSGDSCCPAGANFNDDTDCTPVCGNSVRESDEVCDGGPGCDANCKFTQGQADQMRCLMSAKDDCEKCACMNCTTTELPCRLSADPTANMQCEVVLACSRKNNCVGTPCYCGTNDKTACFLNGPMGLCKAEVEMAAGSTDPLTINSISADKMSVLSRVNETDQCRIMQCRSTCR